MSRPELEGVKRRYTEVIAQLNALEAGDATISEAEARTKEELLEELGKIEHWLWMLEPD